MIVESEYYVYPRTNERDGVLMQHHALCNGFRSCINFNVDTCPPETVMASLRGTMFVPSTEQAIDRAYKEIKLKQGLLRTPDSIVLYIKNKYK